MRRQVRTTANEAITHRHLSSSAEITTPLAPRHPDQVARRTAQAGNPRARAQAFGDQLPEAAEHLTLADNINHALANALTSYPHLLVFSEDVKRKGEVYGITRG